MKIPIFPGFHTIKMVDFPWRTVSLQEGTDEEIQKTSNYSSYMEFFQMIFELNFLLVLWYDNIKLVKRL